MWPAYAVLTLSIVLAGSTAAAQVEGQQAPSSPAARAATSPSSAITHVQFARASRPGEIAVRWTPPSEDTGTTRAPDPLVQGLIPAPEDDIDWSFTFKMPPPPRDILERRGGGAVGLNGKVRF
jgi:hypothetical protein